MKRSRMIGYLTAGALVLLAVTLTSCGGGGYGSGGMGFAPAPFTLLSPNNLVTVTTTTPTLTWTSSLYATDYLVQIDTVNTFPAPVVNTVVAVPTMSYIVLARLARNTAEAIRSVGRGFFITVLAIMPEMLLLSDMTSV